MSIKNALADPEEKKNRKKNCRLCHTNHYKQLEESVDEVAERFANWDTKQLAQWRSLEN